MGIKISTNSRRDAEETELKQGKDEEDERRRKKKEYRQQGPAKERTKKQ